MVICGIDEAGRGCLAGSLAVAGVVLKKDINGVNDSKKLSAKKREELFEIIKENSTYHIILTTSEVIDKIGLSIALKNSILEIMNLIKADKYIIDGNTNFGIKNLKAIIKADSKILEVSASSILAKVSRDREILELAKDYPEYQFQKHKGYGTKLHIEKIKEFGYSKLHRKSFKLKSMDRDSLF